MRDARNARVLAVARLAEHITAQRVTDAIHQLEAQRSMAIDGPSRGDQSGRSTNATSTTERNAGEAARISLMIDDLRDAVHGLEIAHRHVLESADLACRTRAFSEPPEAEPESEIRPCSEGQRSRAGVDEWGEVCDMPATKDGLCGRHYQRMRRWREAHGLPTRSIEPAP